MNISKKKLWLVAALVALPVLIVYGNTITGWTVSLLLIGLSIVVHEFGHWFMARLSSIVVHIFSVGFGSQKWSLGKWWGTEFQVRPIPLGGFIKPDDESLAGASIKARAWLFAGGPLMNLFTAIVLIFSLYASFGKPHVTAKDVFVADVVGAESPAAKAGLLPQDVITSVDGTAVTWPQDMIKLLSDRKSTPVALSVIRNGTPLSVTVTTDEQGRIGAKLGAHPLRVFESVSMGRAALYALTETASGSWQTLAGYGQLLRGRNLEQFESIVGIVVDGGTMYHRGLFDMLFYIAVINIALFVLNVLPMPGLDGGHLMFLAIEKVRGKPVSPTVQGILTAISIGLFIILFFIVLYNDLASRWGQMVATPVVTLLAVYFVKSLLPLVAQFFEWRDRKQTGNSHEPEKANAEGE